MVGYETLALMRKGQVKGIGGDDIVAQAAFVNSLFDVAVWEQLQIIPTAADHFHYPGWNAVKNRPLIGTDYPPLVSPHLYLYLHQNRPARSSRPVDLTRHHRPLRRIAAMLIPVALVLAPHEKDEQPN
jgi:hypothetical protein